MNDPTQAVQLRDDQRGWAAVLVGDGDGKYGVRVAKDDRASIYPDWAKDRAESLCKELNEALPDEHPQMWVVARVRIVLEEETKET